jgi:hypothetical protein
VAGGGFTTLWFGLLAGIAATQITAPPTRWRTWLDPRLTRLLARLWPSLFIAYLACAAGSSVIAAISNVVMLRLTPAVTAATPLVLALILPSALAHDSQHSQAAQQPEGPPPGGRGEHVEVRHGQD